MVKIDFQRVKGSRGMSPASSYKGLKIDHSPQWALPLSAGIGLTRKPAFPERTHIFLDKMMNNPIPNMSCDDLTRFGIGDNKNIG